MKNFGWIKISCVYIGTVIGAGFASGQEIIQFFCIYGWKALLGVIVSWILFSLIGVIVLLRVYTSKVRNFSQFVNIFFNKKHAFIIESIILIYLFCGYCVMISGGGAVFEEQLGLCNSVGIYIMTGVTMVIMLFSITGISVINTIIVPIIILVISIISVDCIINTGFVFSNFIGAQITKTGNWFTSSILYVSYNSIPAIVIMTSLLDLIDNKAQAIKGGLFGGICLGILLISIVIPCLIYYTDVYNIQIPMVVIAGYKSKELKIIYNVILLCAMFTTAIANGYGFIRKACSVININQKLIIIIFCLGVIPLTKVKFARLVSFLYPLFGYIALFMFIFIIIEFIYRKVKQI